MAFLDGSVTKVNLLKQCVVVRHHQSDEVVLGSDGYLGVSEVHNFL